MKSYFFVPANNPKYLRKIPFINADEFILELEDGIPENDLNDALKIIIRLDNFSKYWVRPNMNVEIEGKKLVEKLFEMGFRKIVIPKIDYYNDLNAISKIINHHETKIILLVETPRLLLDLEKVVTQFSLFGLGFGIHDFAKSFGTFPDYDAFKSYFLKILLIAKAYNIKYIDSPSMELDEYDKNSFYKELKFISDMGGDGKFIVHPKQLHRFNETKLYSDEQIQWALKIYQKIFKNSQPIKNFNTLVVDNQIIEKAHLKLVEKIVIWYEKHK